MQEVVYVIEKNIFLAYMFYNIKEDFFLPKNCKINKINEKYITDIQIDKTTDTQNRQNSSHKAGKTVGT